MTFTGLFFAFAMNAQDWIKLRDQGAPFHEIKAAFEDEWEGRTPEKGQGYSHFRRWEQFVEPRISSEVSWTEFGKMHYLAWESAQPAIAKANKHHEKSSGNWTSLGPDDWINLSYAPGNGRVNVVAVHPTDNNTYYVGTPAGGLWKTTNNGNTWTPLTDDLPTPGVSGIAINPQNPEQIYIGTGDADATDSYGIGVLVSEDGGETWSTTGLSWPLDDNIRVHKLMMHPNDPDILFAATSQGFWKTVNGGIVWYQILSGSVRDFEFNTANPDIMYVGRDRFFITTDGGESFDPVTENMPSLSQIGRISIAVSPANPDYVYLLISDDDTAGFLGIYRSTDGGLTFSERATSPNILSSDFDGGGSGGQGWYDLALAVDPEDENHIFTGGVNVWESFNGGGTMQILAHWVFNQGNGPYVHADVHQLDYFNGRLFCASDGGLFSSNNNGNSFINRSEGLEITQCYRIGVQPQDPNRIVLGSQDNGSMIRAGEWYHVQGGDGMQCMFHPTDENKVYVSAQNGALYRSDDSGNSFDWAAPGIDDQGAWTTPWELNPELPEIMYAGYTNVWKSLTGGASWSQVSTNINETLRHIEISPVNTSRVFAATYDEIYVSDNSGQSWTEFNTLGLPSLNISWIEASEFDLNTLYVTTSGFSNGRKVYMTSDNGDTWVNLSDNLPNVPFNTIIEDPSLEGALYVGCDIGVYVKHPDLAVWQPFSTNLPTTIVNELEIHQEAGKLYAGTFGRGVWISDLFELSEQEPVVAFSSDKKTICAGGIIEFTDESLDHYPIWEWSFEGGSPAVSAEQYPEITFESPGVYEVSLTVQNANGTATETKTDFVYVLGGESLPLPYSEGFETVSDFELPEWELLSTDNSPVNWEIDNNTSFSGNSSMTLVNGELDVTNIYEIIGPRIDLSSLDTASISFYMSYAQRHEDNEDRLRLYVSSNCGESWSLRKQWTNSTDLNTADESLDFSPNGDEDWSLEVIELAQSTLVDGFRYKFWFESGNGNDIWIDNINIIEGSVSVNEKERTSLSIYPNPTSTNINISIGSNQIEWLSVLDATGKEVIRVNQTELGSNSETIALRTSDLKGGMYLLTMKLSDGSSLSERFIKR